MLTPQGILSCIKNSHGIRINGLFLQWLWIVLNTLGGYYTKNRKENRTLYNGKQVFLHILKGTKDKITIVKLKT